MNPANVMYQGFCRPGALLTQDTSLAGSMMQNALFLTMHPDVSLVSSGPRIEMIHYYVQTI